MLAAEAAWNTRDPERVAGAYTVDSVWRNRSEFIQGRDQIVAFLRAKWERELDYALRKDLWAFHDNRIAVRFQYEWHDHDGNWFRSYGNENWEFDARRLHAAPRGEHRRRGDHGRRTTHLRPTRRRRHQRAARCDEPRCHHLDRRRAACRAVRRPTTCSTPAASAAW